MSEYRWNQSDAARDYDAAAPVIHPLYLEQHAALVDALPFDPLKEFRLLDLGGGSGRLAERVLDRFRYATVIVLDQSQPFVGLAHERLRRFGSRARTVCRPMQEAWGADLSPAGARLDAVVSTSAIHHLESAEKLELFRMIRAALRPGGVFLNGDEHRPESDAEYRALLEEWGRHMEEAHASGEIPESFGPIIEKWRTRNLEEFGGPRSSGDDCHETVEGQAALLSEAGFASIEVPWHERLWAVTAAS
ncbi:Methyltransferase domain protein [Posidoniimonas polymericola]|uniref:Methyltransferase domain protein n=1 Tax=Posidoniimonas polymericola TaxID=2528002 RepID=A0A5C5ZG00_9BACT|nr:class I SAM-dependent methyltransferase [Posidoniimonas polymericola]TWT85493.1 Methyltransferase domain protein [Posidoniimonas polymericola]